MKLKDASRIALHTNLQEHTASDCAIFVVKTFEANVRVIDHMLYSGTYRNYDAWEVINEVPTILWAFYSLADAIGDVAKERLKATLDQIFPREPIYIYIGGKTDG